MLLLPRLVARIPVLLFLAGLAFFLLVGCGPAAATAAPTDPPPSATAEPLASTPTGAPVEATPEVSSSAPSFAGDVQPIFAANCTRCHGSSRQSGGLRLDSYAGLLAGGKNGPVVLAGDAPGSLLVQLVERGRMPKNGARLTEAAVQTIVDWIAAGALDD